MPTTPGLPALPRRYLILIATLLAGVVMITSAGVPSASADLVGEDPAPVEQEWTLPEGADAVQVSPSVMVVDREGGIGLPREDRSDRATLGGYKLWNPDLGLNSGYTVRHVVTTSNAYLPWASVFEDVRLQAEYITGAPFPHGPYANSHLETGYDEIGISVERNSPCGPLDRIDRPSCTIVFWDAGRIWNAEIGVCVCVHRADTTGVLLRAFGYALGLSEYASRYEGRLQIMHPTSEGDMRFYRSGDVNGIRRMVANGFGGGTAPTHPPGEALPFRASLGEGTVINGTWGGAPAFGLPIDNHQIQATRGDSSALTTVGASRAGSITVTGGGTYSVRVRAHNAKGWGPWSNSNILYVPPRCTPSMSDVLADDAFCDEIKWLLAEDIASGFSGDTFRPGESVTRQAMAAFLMREAERLVPGSTAGDWSGATGFSDVPGSHPFHDEIKWLASTGITTGYEDGAFKPGRDINRQGMAAMLMRFTEYLYPGSTAGDWSGPSGFTDVGFIHVFHNEITWFGATDIAGGFHDGSFRPEDDVTRQAMAAFLFRHDETFGSPA